MSTTSRVIAYPYPRISPRSATFKVRAGGQEVLVYHTSCGDFAAFACDDAVEVEIEAPGPVKSVRVAPARHGITPAISGKRVCLQLARPMHLLIEVEGLPQLYLYADAPDRDVPSPEDPDVRYFRAGQVYEVGELRLGSNQTMYIEGGAVVRGCVRATSATNVRIAGRGVLDGSYYRQGVDGRRSIMLEGCRDSRVEGIVMVEPSTWMLVLGACENVSVDGIKQLGEVAGSDGVDIVGCRHIRVRDCFCRNGDDCIAIKSLDLRPHDKGVTLDYARDVEDIEISGCSFVAYRGGQAMEIGHELRTESIRSIRFRDCDVLAVHQYGAPFSIHNADRATVSDVRYEDVRVEHHFDKLVDLRIFESRWSKDEQRGQIRDVTFRNIDVAISVYNAGHTCSVIGGPDGGHTVEGVRFEGFRMAGKTARCADDMDLYSKNAGGISFR